MKVYVVESNNPLYYEEPRVYTDGNVAIADIKEEYEKELNQLAIDNEGYDSVGCHVATCDWGIEKYSGEATIDRNFDCDRWQWRLTEREIFIENNANNERTCQCEETFTDEELRTISNGLLALIRSATSAKRLVSDGESQKAIDKEIKRLIRLNNKVCGKAG